MILFESMLTLVLVAVILLQVSRRLTAGRIEPCLRRATFLSRIIAGE